MKGIALLTGVFLLFSQNLFANNKTICGSDNRTLSSDPRIGRLLSSMEDRGGCTFTMIGRTCALSAGHCKSVMRLAEFNTPESNDNGEIQHPPREEYPESSIRTHLL